MSLTEQQLESIKLLSTGKLQKDVAQALGITPKTLQRWGKLTEYQEKLTESTKKASAITADSQESLQRGTIPAQPKTVEELLEDKARLRIDQFNSLKMAQNAILPQVEEGDLRAIAAFIKLSETITKLLDLYPKNDSIANAIEVLEKAKILPYQITWKYKEYERAHQQRLETLALEPKPKPNPKVLTPEEEINWLSNEEEDINEQLNWLANQYA
jgi:hypothetical protein